MEKIKIIFIFEEKKEVIECYKSDLYLEVKEIFKRRIKIDINNNIQFYFKGNKIDLNNNILMQKLIDKEREIKIIGISLKKNIEKNASKNNKEKKIKGNIICKQCLEEYNLKNDCLINFENYKIYLSDCNKGHKQSDLLLEEFDLKQFINENDSNENNYKSSIHQNAIFCSLCIKCKENLCFVCENNHIHKDDIISFNKILFKNDEYIDNLNKKMIELRNKLDKLIDEIDKIKYILDYEINNIEKYFTLVSTIINNYDINKRKYSMIQNIKQINLDYIIKDVENIIKTKNLNEKFNQILSIYNKMGYKNEIRILYKYSKKNKKIRLFGQKFVEKNKKLCKLIIDNKETDLIEFYENKETTPKSDKIEIILKNINKVTDMSSIFNKCYSLESIPDFSKINMSSITNIAYMFFYCSSLKSIPDISRWEISSVTDMSSLFSKCPLLTELPDISKWNTFSVIYMNHLFAGCQSLKYLPDISKWDISSALDISSMFSGCCNLSCLPDISIWNTSSVTNMSYLFNFCSSLRELPDISKWNISSCINTSYMFSDCIILKSLPDISKWNTSSVTTIQKMFNFCKLIKTLPDISKWNTSSVTDMSYLFAHCYSLLYLPDISKWDTSKLTKIDKMFSYCNSLSNLPDISNWNTSNIKSKENIFLGCDKLECLPEFKENNNCFII